MEISKIKDKLFNGEIKPYKIEQLLFEQVNKDITKWSEVCETATRLRLEYIKHKTNSKLEKVSSAYPITELEGMTLTGIENKIGGVVIPLGYSGPVKINGEHTKGEFYIPLATNEAALVGGNNRGVSAINQAGGMTTVITDNRMTRAPVVELENIIEAKQLVLDLHNDSKLYQQLEKSVEDVSPFVSLISIKPFQMGRRVWLRISYDTSNAMGMNAVTKHSAIIIHKLIELKPKIKLIALSGNMCTDKKASHVNVLLGKGKSVEGEIIFPRAVIEKVWKTTPENMIKVNNIKNWQGSALSGTVTGFNANIANTIAAFFAATGQDLAHVTTSSTGYDLLELTETGDLRFNISLPNIEVGSVGGGMFFGTAKECLEMIGCTGNDDGKTNAKKVAEICAVAVAAQEINLIGTLANQFELAESHVKLARGEKMGEDK